MSNCRKGTQIPDYYSLLLHLLQHLVGIASIEGAIGAYGEMFVAAAHKVDIDIGLRLTAGSGVAGRSSKGIHVAAAAHIAVARARHIP